MRRTVIVMVKEPRPGRVKTRLGRDIGMTAAAWWYRHQVSRLLRRLDDPFWDTVLAVAPDRAVYRFPIRHGPVRRIPQGPGDLGDRMTRAIRQAPPGPVLVIGSDVPGITRAGLKRAFGALQGKDAVIGPAPDGGYWLIGVRHPGVLPRNALSDVRWSGPYARADTLRGLGTLRLAEVHRLADVDTAEDLDAVVSE